MNRIAFVAIIAIFLFACTENETLKSESLSKKELLINQLTAELDSMSNANGFIGFAVAIANEKGTIYTHGFGYTNKETKEKYTENTIQHIASVSKTSIGLALMKAQEMGKLKLDDPIGYYLPFEVVNPFHPDGVITLRHLATHTSGINDTDQYMDHAWVLTEYQSSDHTSSDYYAQVFNPSTENMPMETYLNGYLGEGGVYYQPDNFIDFPPGERYNYSNIGATLAALIIESATEQAFDEFTTEHIYKPLQMNSTGWSLEDVDVSKHSRLYRSDSTLLPFYTAITYPDGMLITSSSDMAKYATELIKGYRGEGSILTRESYAEYFRTQLEEKHFEAGSRDANHPYDGDYDPALFIGHSASGYVGHSGGDAGVSSWFYFDKEKSLGTYMVMNTDIGNRKTELEYYAIWDKIVEYASELNQSEK
jgi:CubicO group peptidase (beta-lactamase class C family)